MPSIFARPAARLDRALGLERFIRSPSIMIYLRSFRPCLSLGACVELLLIINCSLDLSLANNFFLQAGTGSKLGLTAHVNSAVSECNGRFYLSISRVNNKVAPRCK
jgi:hypothetical protein